MPIRSPWFHSLFITALLIATIGHVQAKPKRRPATRPPTSEKTATPSPVNHRCDEKTPWYCGVSAEDRMRAMELYKQGNQRFDDGLFQPAVTSYRAALVYWNHPGIHYNLMLALIALEQPIEAYLSSIEALRYGTVPLEPDAHRRASDYQKLLRGRIAELTVACDEPGATVSLDGKIILKSTGKVHLYVLPGQHEIVARKPGYLATHHALTLAPNKPTSVHLRMLPTSEALVTTRRWSSWRPWAMVGAGAGVGLVGGVLEWRAVASNRVFQTLLSDNCPPTGCSARDYSDEMKLIRQRSQWYLRLGHGASVAGGVAMLGGLVLVYLNRPQDIENPERANLVRVSLMPFVTPSTGGLAVSLTF